MPINDLVRNLILYVPTLLFLFIMLVSVAFGIFRGYHKSKVMFLHSLIIGGFFAIIYFILMNTASFDEFVVSLVNRVMGENYLQTTMNVSIECKTLTDILIEYIPKQMAIGDGINIILKDNGAYLKALVNLIYHLIFFVIFLVLYFVVKLITSIVYLITYREYKYSLKRNKKFANYNCDQGYRRRTLKGGLLGFGRGLICSLLIFSMLGGTLYSVTGGLGKNDLEDVYFGDEEVDKYLDLYKAIDSYGTKGIFKVLNSVKDGKDVPVYLYVADLVFRGGYKDEEIEADINLRNELSNLTHFSKESLKLMLNFGGEDVKNIILGNITDEQESMDIILNVFNDPSFQLKFLDLFDEFDTESYMFNFSLSLVDSIIANIETLENDLDSESVEILKILFKKDYKSSVIPYENEMLKDKDDTVLPYIKPSNLIKKNDINIILQLVLDAIQEANIPQEELYQHVFNNIKQLSILRTNRKNEVNPVLGRLFAYIESTQLVDKTTDIVTLSKEDIALYHNFLYYQDVDWVKEINDLFDNIYDIQTLQNNLGEEEDFIKGFTTLFDVNNEHYIENRNAYRRIKTYVSDSKLVSRLLGSPVISQTLETQLKSMMPNMYFKENLVFENTYDKSGNLVKRGELSNLLNILEFFVKEENTDLFNELFNGDNIDIETVQTLVYRLNSVDENNVIYRDYVTDSDLLRSVISSALITYTDNLIYVPNISKDKDIHGDPVDVIKKEQMEDLFNKLDVIIDLITPIMNDPNNIYNIDNLLNDYRLEECLNNPIIEATIANQIIINIDGNSGITLSESLKTPEGWVTTDGNSELTNIISSIKLLNVRVSDIVTGNIDGMDLVNRIQHLSNEEVNNFFDSKVLTSTVSSFIVNSDNFTGVKIIVPSTVLNDDDVIEKKDLVDLVNLLKDIDLNIFNETNPNRLLTTLIGKRDLLLSNDIIVTTVVYNLKDQLPSELTLTPTLKNDSTIESLKVYSTNNAWRKELPALFDVMESLFMDPYGNVDINNGLMNIESTIIHEYNKPSKIDPSLTNLDVLCNSGIILSNVTNIFDDMLVDIIDKGIKPVWKDEDNNFKKEEIENVLQLVNSLGIEDFNYINFDRIDFNNQGTKDSIKNSYLIRAIVTSEINPLYEQGLLAKSYDAIDNYNILKADEILAFVTILDGNSLNSFNIDNINLSLFKDLLYNKDGNTSSYILAATTSKFILDNNLSLVIPKRVYRDGVIAPKELRTIIHSLELLLNRENNLRVYDINFENIRIPSDTRIAKEIIKSDIINATVVKNLQFDGKTYVLSNTNKNYFNGDKELHEGKGFIVNNVLDYKGNNIALFTEGEFESLCYAIDKIGSLDGNLSFNIDAKKIDQLLSNKNECDRVLSSTFIHVYISGIVDDAITLLESTGFVTVTKGPNEPYNVNVYDLSNLRSMNMKIYSCKFIRDTLINYKDLIGLFA